MPATPHDDPNDADEPTEPGDDDAREAWLPESALDRIVAEAGEVLELAARFPEPPDSRWRRAGLSPRGARRFNIVAVAVLLLFVTAWSLSLVDARRAHADSDVLAGGRRDGLSMPTARIAAALTEPDLPAAAYLTDAALRAFSPDRGASGRLRAVIRDPGAPLGIDAVPEGAEVALTPGGRAAVGDSAVPAEQARVPRRPGIWQLALTAGRALQPVSEFSVITRRPIADRRNGRVGLYFIGTWPTEQRAHTGYRTPSGFIEVTPDNQRTQISEHFQLRHFLTKGQDNVWPKYLVLDMRLVDKLELVLAELQASGIDTRGVRVLSGFRTPQYNETGGNTAGRASLSRHMYGDAADIFIDNSGDGGMDDLNGDGRLDVEDARVIVVAAERVEQRHPALIGGVGLYRAGPGHGPFVHIDTRGYRARW